MPMPVVFGALAVLFIAIGLAAIPMLRDAGPVERLGGRIGGVREAVERTSVTAKLVEALAARLGPRLAPSLQGFFARSVRRHGDPSPAAIQSLRTARHLARCSRVDVTTRRCATGRSTIPATPRS